MPKRCDCITTNITRATSIALNSAIAPYPEYADTTIEQLLQKLDQVPENIRTRARNHGGGHANHQFFWKVIGLPKGGKPRGALSAAIAESFGSFEVFQERFTDAATKHFGAGWAFLATDAEKKKLEILTLPNQDSVLPLRKPGLLACDVWEHA